MKKLLIVLLLITLFAAPSMAGNDANTTLYYDFQDSELEVLSYAPCTSVIFEYMGLSALAISWKDGTIDVEYGENVTKTEAADIFFDFLKRYIRGGYNIIPKERRK